MAEKFRGHVCGLRKKRRGRGKERAGARVKATEGEREVHCFVVDDLLLCSRPSRSVGESQLEDILKEDSVPKAVWRERQSVLAPRDAQNPSADRWSHKRPSREVDVQTNGTESRVHSYTHTSVSTAFPQGCQDRSTRERIVSSAGSVGTTG